LSIGRQTYCTAGLKLIFLKMKQSTSILKPYPGKEEISAALGRYGFVIKVFEELIEKIKNKNLGDNRWFIFSEKIGKKYLTQAFTLQQIFSDNTFIFKTDNQRRIIDFSSIFSLLRVQLETYAVFFHLFIDRCDMEEKIIRFRLWELDGLRSRQKYLNPSDSDFLNKTANETKRIENCIAVINQFSYFKNLDKEIQGYLIKYATWKFNDNSLRSNDKNKRRLSVEQMIMNTGLKATHFNDWYSYMSTHTHTTYWSVIENDTLTDEDRITTEYVAMMQATFITSFFIKDFCKIYQTAKDYFNSLTPLEQEIIDSFDVSGRNN
jgi:hypothetical protein